MADNASIARPYAKAVFDLAQETDSFEAWTTALNQLTAIGNDESFMMLVNDPRFEGAKIVELINDLAQDTLPAGGSNLVNLLVQNDRLSAMPDIGQQYADLVAKAQALVNAEVVTAMALSEAQKSSLISALEDRLGMKVELAETVDSGLVGGAIIRAGDLVIDGSAKGRIEKLTTALMR